MNLLSASLVQYRWPGAVPLPDRPADRSVPSGCTARIPTRTSSPPSGGCGFDYGLADERRIPTWLIEALEALVDGREVDRVRFPRVGSDVSSLAAELIEIVPGWQHEDVGEWLVATFPALGIELVISREALDAEGRSCCSYSVRPSPVR